MSTMECAFLIQEGSCVLKSQLFVNQILLDRVVLAIHCDLKSEKSLFELTECTHLVSELSRHHLEQFIRNTISYKTIKIKSVTK
jgi:hypothetical protein